MQLTKELENTINEKELLSNQSSRKISNLNNKYYELECKVFYYLFIV